MLSVKVFARAMCADVIFCLSKCKRIKHRSTRLSFIIDIHYICYVQVIEVQISKGNLKVVDKPANVFRIAIIERKHKRRIVNFEELLDKCQAWQLPKGTKYSRVECSAINLDDPSKYLENLSWLRSIDVLVSPG